MVKRRASRKEEVPSEDVEEVSSPPEEKPQKKRGGGGVGSRKRKFEKIEKEEEEDEEDIVLRETEGKAEELSDPFPICGFPPSAVIFDATADITAAPIETPAASSSSVKIPRRSKKELLLEDFVVNQLPAMKKEIKLKKKGQKSFNVRDYPQYFKANSGFMPTYCLSLFNFLGKNEILCTHYGIFHNPTRHMIKTVEGFNHANLLLTSLGVDALTGDETEHIMKKFGTEWFKIPAKDEPRVSSAYRFGDKHQFKVILTGIYEDSFFDEDGEEIITANPVLRYEPYRAPATTQPRAKKAKKDVAVVSVPSEDAQKTVNLEETYSLVDAYEPENEDIL